MNNKWKTVSKKVVWDKRVELVDHTVILPSGLIDHYLVQHGIGAVAVLINPKKNQYVVSYQYRYPLNQWIYDLPGGGMKEGETPESAIKRESLEETGFKLNNLIFLTKVYPNPGRADWPIFIFFCRDCKRVSRPVDIDDEQVKIKFLNTESLEKLILNNRIIDPFLLLAWYIAKDKGLF